MSQDDFETPAVNTYVDALEEPIAGPNDEQVLGEDGVANTNKAPAGEAQSDTGAPDSSEKPTEGIFRGLKFYVAHNENREELLSLIRENGGEVLSALPSGGSAHEFVVSPYNTTNLATVTPAYIKSCCTNNVLMKLQNYLVPFDEFRAVIDTQLQNDNGDKTEDTVAADPAKDMAIDVNIPEVASNAVPTGGSQADPANATSGTPGTTGVAPTTAPVADTEKTLKQEPHGETKSEPSATESTHVVSEVHPPVTVAADSNAPADPAYENARPTVPKSRLPSHNKSSFTEEEDEFILDVVRKNPTRRTTHTLFDEISHYVPDHTGNSIRHRYRVYLAKRLKYVYEVDASGKLVRDENGNLIKTNVLPKSLKNKFTAEEDYSLATDVKKQFYRDLYQLDPDTGKSLITDDDAPNEAARRALMMDPNNIPGSEPSFQQYRVGERRGPVPREFFKTYAEKNPNHTENAWRDRFRKFLLSYGIDNYVAYYEREMDQGRSPEAMKNMTNRPKRPGVPTPGNYNSYAKRARSLSHQQQQQAAAAAAAVAVQGNDPNTGVQYSIPEGDLLDEETLNFISGLRRDLSRIESNNNMAFEYPQDIAESIRNDFTNEESQFDNFDPDDIPFPPQLASTELFMPHFFQFNSTRQFLDKVNEVISRDYEPSQAEKLVQDLCDEAGVRKTFSTGILTALSGDLMVFPRYFLCMFKYNANPPLNIPGIWTREDDELLRSGNEEDVKALTRKHGVGRIEMRKRFIASDLV
ncbi:LAMI_0F14510g1_1 [Lachancea mirantina]|uniref:DNA-binding protein RAP1 n=1 Tax=Lachancea mirantina TaxID=1230905 RepID=A0A1G4K3V5_9SACH|nr:LAMI_0F14510g1_1 [Lachancea mirantina]